MPMSKNITKPLISFTLHHLKLAAVSVPKALRFYTEVLPFVPVPSRDHYNADGVLYGAILSTTPFQDTPSPNISDGIIIELRQNEQQALAQKSWDPVTWGVPDIKTLEHWGKWFDENGVKHSRVLRALLGWTMVAEDPDGRFVKLYTTEETHEWNIGVENDDYWLGTAP